MTREHSAGSDTVDVVGVMNHAEFRGVPVLVSVLTVLAMVFDGFDIQAIAFAAPGVLAEFGIGRPQLGPILAAGLVGIAVGAFVLGPAGDRFGRRFALTASLIIVAVMSLGAATAQSPEQLAAWRFATGIGLGGVVPNCTTLMLEFAPLAVRNTIVVLTVVGVPIGGVLGAAVAAQIMPVFGWRAIFVVGAALLGVLALVILLWLPESPRYLARVGNQGARLAALLNRITRRNDFRENMQFEVREADQSAKPASVSTLLSPQYRRDTLLIWLIFLTNIFAVYAFFNWLPTVLSAAGLSLTIALRGALVFNLGGVLAALLLAACMSRFGSRPTLAAVGAGAILTTLAMGFVHVVPASAAAPSQGVVLLLCVMGLSGACILGMQTCMYAVAASAYPTSVRSTGVGWASGLSRVGGILSSFAGGALLAQGGGMQPFFIAIAVVLIPTLLGVLLLRRHLPATRAVT